MQKTSACYMMATSGDITAVIVLIVRENDLFVTGTSNVTPLSISSRCDVIFVKRCLCTQWRTQFQNNLRILSNLIVATWCKRFGARLPPPGSRVRVSFTPYGFRGGWNGASGKVFLEVSPVFPCEKFYSTISPHSSHPFRFISSASTMVRQAWSTGILAIHWTYNIGASSHLVSRPGHVSGTSWGCCFL